MRPRRPLARLTGSSSFLALVLTVLFAPRAVGAPGNEPTWRLLAQDDHAIQLELRLPELTQETLDIGGESYLALAITGGGIVGEDGQPALPIIGRLVAVPAGSRVAARVVAQQTHDLPPARLLPVQPDKATSFVIDRTAYAHTGPVTVSASSRGRVVSAPGEPTVMVGAPQILAGQTVVPVAVAPVVYDPARERITVASRIVVELRLDDPQADPAPASRCAAPSASVAMASAVLGLESDRSVAAPGDSPGTWAVVCRDATVLAHLQPLIDWRREQGYHVETIVTTATAAVIKGQLQALYDDPDLPPLRFIVLAGDANGTYPVPTWHESLSGFQGEGDLYYATLDGDDILADAHVGRLSFTTLPMLDTIVAKIVGYETAPPLDHPAWLDSACLIGDPSDSGISTVFVNQWLKGQLRSVGYTTIDTIWGGDFSTQFYSAMNQGRSVLGYRGILGMSGISTALINSLSNGGRLAVAVMPTCDTGSFEELTTCHSEAFLRAPNGGAVAAIATATTGTHTRYNNCYYLGIWNGLINGGDPRVGVAHTLGQLELYNNYYLAEPEAAEIWAVWNNIMGDPATSIWLGAPSALTVAHPAQLSVNTGAVAIDVTSGGNPVAGARACLFRDGAVQISGETDAAGQVLLATPPLTAGTYDVTVSGSGLLPYLGTMSVGTVDVACSLAQVIFDDSAGNADGVLEPGESALVQVAVSGDGTQTATGVTGTLSGGDPWTTVQSGDLGFGDVAPGAVVWSQTSASITVASDAPDGTVVSWPLLLSNGADTWTAVVQTTIHGAAFSVTDLAWSAGATFEPGQSGELTVTLTDVGTRGATGVSAVLTTDSPWIQITSDSASFGDIAAGSSAANATMPFAITVHPACYRGHLAILHLAATYDGQRQATADFAITVGEAATSDPTGPGDGGYYAFDDTDDSAWYAPTYDWVALDPQHGGTGTDVGLEDFGSEQDDTRTVDLPFVFRYGSRDFDRVSICSNGWLAMGETPLRQYRNFSIPSAGAPGDMLAVFWDDLYQTTYGRVYSQYDEAGHRFIVQWYNLQNSFADAVQNFEVILLDPAWHPTATGDGVIIFQYETVNNNDGLNGYATVGIGNHDHDGGLLYTYWNRYAPGAATLTSGRAIRFEPLGQFTLPTATVQPASFQVAVQPGGQVTRNLHISNPDPDGVLLSYAIATADPATLPPAASAKRDGAVPLPPDIQGSTLTLSTNQYQPGATVDIEVSVHAEGSGPLPLLSYANLQMPAGVTLNSSDDLAVNGNPALFWQGQTGEGVLTEWDGLSGGYIHYIATGSTATATINVTFAPDLFGILEFAYALRDMGYFGDPDQVAGTIELTSSAPGIRVLAPAAGDVVVIGQVTDVVYATWEISGQVDIALQREDGGEWQTLATGIAADPWPWTVTGEPGPYARIRVSDTWDPSVSHESGVFAVGRDVSWVELGQTAGDVQPGGQQTIAFTLQAADLAVGSYEAALVITTSGAQTIVVPIDLLVDPDATQVDDLPATVALLGNHPNPFNPATVISFATPSAMTVTLDLFSVDGRHLRRLLQGSVTAGVHDVLWDGKDGDGRTAAAGVYMVRLVTADGARSSKMLLAK